MDGCSKIMQAEKGIILRIQQNEAWYEGERRHSFVDINDPAVTGRCNEIMMKNVTEIEKEAVRQCISQNEECRQCLKCISIF